MRRPRPTPGRISSFLHPPAAPAEPGGVQVTWSALGELLVSFAQTLGETTRASQRGRAFRGQLLHRSTAPLGRAGWGDAQFELRTEGADRCALVVRVSVPGRNPLAQQGARGRLQAGAVDLRAVSDATGALVFSGIARHALDGARVAISFDDLPPDA